MCISLINILCLVVGLHTLYLAAVPDYSLYPENSLKYGEETALYALGGTLPSPRVHHTITSVENFIIVYGGYSTDDSFLEDISIFDTRSQTWSGVITRVECCNSDGKTIDVLGLGHPLNVPQSRVGFQGDIPLARAEHSAVALDGQLYIFGGNSRFGLLNDLYIFDPIALLWSPVQDSEGSTIPTRRAGHSMITTNGKAYVFGGRSVFPIITNSNNNNVTQNFCGMNDVWQYDPIYSAWTLLTPTDGNQPVGRQFAAATVAADRIWVFGGMDPSSRLVFNDLWAFSLSSNTWTCIQANSGTITGFSPPPLYLAHLIPVSQTSPSSGVQKQSFLIYGGVGSTGVCGLSSQMNTDKNCPALQTAFGQLYRVDMSFGQWTSAHLQSAVTNPDSNFVSSISWQFARLTSASTNVGQESLRKLFAFESTAFSTDRSLLFEFGGMQVSNSVTEEALLRDAQKARGLYTPLSLSAGGNLGSPLWDLLTGEQIRQSVDIPANGLWDYTDGFISPQPLSNKSAIVFLDEFRVYSVSFSDMILLENKNL